MIARPAAAGLLAAWIALAGCAAPYAAVRRRRALSPDQRVLVDRTFYLAVSAYTKGRYVEARRHVDEILRIEPGNPHARDMRRRLNAVRRQSL
ncbi:MAG: hypothetical protein PHF00_06800 [Elusimicrobia bacterium]|nr:hypothetical protein [Elusimicrobiota bacterium]